MMAVQTTAHAFGEGRRSEFRVVSTRLLAEASALLAEASALLAPSPSASIEALPSGAILMYPYGQSQTPDRRVLEDNGVIPDVQVTLDRTQLLKGIDSQLEAAIEYLTKTADFTDAED